MILSHWSLNRGNISKSTTAEEASILKIPLITNTMSNGKSDAQSSTHASGTIYLDDDNFESFSNSVKSATKQF